MLDSQKIDKIFGAEGVHKKLKPYLVYILVSVARLWIRVYRKALQVNFYLIHNGVIFLDKKGEEKKETPKMLYINCGPMATTLEWSIYPPHPMPSSLSR